MSGQTAADVVAGYSDTLLEAAYRDLRGRNLRDYANHETRWCADRLKALSQERRKRKALGNYHP